MAITKATASSIAPAAKGDLVVGSATNDAGVLAVGTNTHILVADSTETLGMKWAAPAAGGGFTLLSTTTLSGASVTVSGISGAYQDLYIYLDRFYPATNDRTIRMRLNGDTGSNYRFQTHTDAGNATSGETSFGIAFDVANTRDDQNAGFYWLYNYSNATTYKSLQQHARYAGQATASTYGWSMYQGQYASTSAITSVTFFPVSGNWGGGTIYIYGVK